MPEDSPIRFRVHRRPSQLRKIHSVNRLVGEKVSIVTDKPQTTRNVIRGIVTRPEGQIVFLDTPGVHKPIHRMNERMMKSVRERHRRSGRCWR